MPMPAGPVSGSTLTSATTAGLDEGALDIADFLRAESEVDSETVDHGHGVCSRTTIAGTMSVVSRRSVKVTHEP